MCVSSRGDGLGCAQTSTSASPAPACRDLEPRGARLRLAWVPSAPRRRSRRHGPDLAPTGASLHHWCACAFITLHSLGPEHALFAAGLRLNSPAPLAQARLPSAPAPSRRPRSTSPCRCQSRASTRRCADGHFIPGGAAASLNNCSSLASLSVRPSDGARCARTVRRRPHRTTSTTAITHGGPFTSRLSPASSLRRRGPRRRRQGRSPAPGPQPRPPASGNAPGGRSPRIQGSPSSSSPRRCAPSRASCLPLAPNSQSDHRASRRRRPHPSQGLAAGGHPVTLRLLPDIDASVFPAKRLHPSAGNLRAPDAGGGAQAAADAPRPPSPRRARRSWPPARASLIADR